MPSVELESARTTKVDPEEAAEHLVSQLRGVEPKMVVLYASRDRDHVALNKAVRRRLPNARLLGASTGGEIDRAGIHRGSVVLGALSGDFEVGIGLGKELGVAPVEAADKATGRACEQLGVRNDDLASKKHVALVIDDAFQWKKDELLLGLMSRNQGLMAVGGGASDHETDPAKQSALIHVDGEVATDSVAVAIFKTDAPWGALRAHSYHPTGQTLRITKVDSSATRALEIDGVPAAKRYAELLGVEVEDLEFGKPKGFARMPTALRVGREYFIRAPWKPLDDGSILFANLLEEGTELELVKMGDLVRDTKHFFETEIAQRVANPQAALVFHCSGRYWYAQTTDSVGALSQTFANAPPCVGFNAHFEVYCGFHINTTLTTLVFGRS
ncbi:hypothetical protein AKJ09_05746 [Labilithrix luteola]|uniref:FIST domain-containing protein n=1 Tax=Labilithrix luteola TaxID=1391654 RepID=A0A0K1Q007_9BACT|nr:FIST N-terminal domain-containing protein [Labilithrix luteola]AKU99082.1 hypothetical protein AKJ09_05746 [Labilithrix luteola]